MHTEYSRKLSSLSYPLTLSDSQVFRICSHILITVSFLFEQSSVSKVLILKKWLRKKKWLRRLSKSTVKLLDQKGGKSYFFGSETTTQLDYNIQALNQAKKSYLCWGNIIKSIICIRFCDYVIFTISAFPCLSVEILGEVYYSKVNISTLQNK